MGSQFVDEVPSAFGSVIPGGLGVPAEPIYYIPVTDTYTILLDGQLLTQTKSVGLTQFGPGYAVSANGIKLEADSKDRLFLAANGTQIVYESTNNKAITLTLALDTSIENDEFEVRDAKIGSNQVITLTDDIAGKKLVFDNKQGSSGAYDLVFKRTGDTGRQEFLHKGIPISAADTHYVDYGQWNGSDTMILGIDQGSKGTINRTLRLENQAYQIYLPVILSNDLRSQ